jgi:hypothetical protein
MELQLYYKYKELIDNIFLSKLKGKIMLIDNKMYIKIDERIYENDCKMCYSLFNDLNIILPIIEDDDFYFKIHNAPLRMNPMDLYYYYNIKKLKEENKQMKDLLKNIVI